MIYMISLFRFFFKYPIIGEKFKDFSDFVKVAELVKEKAHLTKEGLELIADISSGMNTGRVIDLSNNSA